METDLVNCPQMSQSENKSTKETDEDSQLTEDRETQGEELEKKDVETTCKIERTETPPPPHGAHIILPADGAVEPNMDDPNSEQAQEWPPVPEPEEYKESERDECQEGVKTITESTEDALTPVWDDEGEERVEMAQVASEHEVKSNDDFDSVYLSENSKEQNADIADSISESNDNAQNVQQEELGVNKQCSLNENELEQQVCDDAPPLDTVAGEPISLGRDSPACSSTEVKEPLTITEARRDGEREERREEQTGGPEEKRQAEAKDQEQVNKETGEEKVNRMDVVDHCEDSQSDSGVSADFSPNSTTDASDCPANGDDPQLSESPPNETPIEREIRLAMLREQNLRRARGLDDVPDKTKEYVEIQVRKPVLSQEVQSKPSPNQSKDKMFAGNRMQMEISAEVERENVLVELGRLPGYYDKGTEAQLQEKKQLFESFQEPKESVPNPAGRILDVDSTVDVKQRLMQFSQNSPNPPSVSAPDGPHIRPSPALGPALTEATTAQVIIIETTPVYTTTGASSRSNETMREENLESVKSSSVEPVAPNIEVNKDKDDTDSSLAQENPFFKLRTSVSLLPQVEQDIKEAKERERELQIQRTSLYGGSAVEPEAERATEIDSSVEKGENTESRVEEGRTSSSEEIISSPSHQTNLTPSACQSEMTCTPTSVRQSTGKLELMWPPPQSDEEQKQSEKASRTPRQRNPLLDRWESGIINGHVEDCD